MAACLLAASTASAADLSGSYLCVQEVGGGLRFDPSRTKWVAGNFSADDKYVFNLSYAGEGADAFGNFSAHRVTVSRIGNNGDPIRCYGEQPDGNVTVRPTLDFFICTALKQFHVDLTTMRFLEIYPNGFIDGLDNNGNTPSIFGGSCAKIS